MDHNIFWQTDVLYVSPAIDNESEPDSIDVTKSVRDTSSFVTDAISLPSALKIAPDLRSLTFRSDSLTTQDLSIRIPTAVTDFPDTMVKVGQTHQYLINVAGYPSAYTFKPITLPQGLDTIAVRGQPRLLIWAPTSNDVGIHPIAMEITDSYGEIDTLSYNLKVFNAVDFPDTSSFRSLFNAQGRFTGMYREIYSHDVPHTAGERYLFNLDVWGNKSVYNFNPIQLPNAAFSNSLTESGIIDWTPTAEDVGRHHIEVEISTPSGAVDTLTYSIYVFEDHAFPDTTGTLPPVTLSLLPDTTDGLAQFNGLSPSFSSTESAVGNLYADPALLDSTYNRYELIVGASPGIDAGPGETSFFDKNGTRNDIGYWGGPLHTSLPNPTLGSEIEITTKPDSLLIQGQTFVYDPVQANNAPFTVVDLITYLPGSDIPESMTPSNPFGNAPPIEWTPTKADTGKYIIGLKSYAEDGSFGRHYFPLRVRPENEIPYSLTEPDTTAAEDIVYTFTIVAKDVDQDDIFFQLVEGPKNLSVNKDSGIITWLPTQEQVGQHDATVRIEDSRGATSNYSWSILVQPTNDAPVIISEPDTLAQEDVPFQYNVLVKDPDPSDIFFPTLISGPAGVTIDSLGRLNWTPLQSQIGLHQIEIVVRDQNDANTKQTFSVDVKETNDAPLFTVFEDTTAMEDNLYEIALIATDEDDNNLEFALENGPIGMVLKKPNILSWLPSIVNVGSHEVTISATDPSGLSDTLNYRLHVEEVNDPPSITSKTPVNSNIFNAEETLLFRVNVEDEESDEIEYSWLRNGTNIPNAIKNSLAFSPVQNQLDSITVIVKDIQNTTRFTWHVDLRSMPRASVSSTGIDFSRVTIGDTLLRNIQITNIGDQTLDLDSLRVGSSFFDAALSNLSLNPGQSSELNLRFSPTTRGVKFDTVRFVSNDPDNEKIEVMLAGNGYIGSTINFDLSSSIGDQKARAASLSGGQEFGLGIYAYDTVDLQSFRVTLEFDSSLLHFANFNPDNGGSEINILAQNGRVPTYKIEYNESNSSLTLSGSIAAGGVSGNGLIGVVNFNVDSLVNRGTTPILMKQGLITSDQAAIPDTVDFVSSAVISLRPKIRGDFDFDLDVDFDDFFIFSDSFGQETFNPLTDLNGDGKVSFDDFFIFSDAFGQATFAKISTEKIYPAKFGINIEKITTDRLEIAPSWNGKVETKGFVIGLNFDPNELIFDKYVGRNNSPALALVIDSMPGQVTVAVGASSDQHPLDKLGTIEFIRVSNSKTTLNPTIAMHYSGNGQATRHRIPDELKVEALPLSFMLYPAHPNPFNPETTIRFYSPRRAFMQLTVYDLLGQPIRKLMRKETLPGYQKIVWDGRNDNGTQVATGTYFLAMEIGNFRQLQKLLLLK